VRRAFLKIERRLWPSFGKPIVSSDGTKGKRRQKTTWFEVRALVVNLLFSKVCGEGARYFRCTTVHNHAQLNHAKFPQQLTDSDRLFWRALSRLWRTLQNVLLIVRPATVARWHRQGYRSQALEWSWPRTSPRIHPLIRAVIRTMCLSCGLSQWRENTSLFIYKDAPHRRPTPSADQD